MLFSERDIQALGGVVGGNKHTAPRDVTHTEGVGM
jgi:hypothetical protein